MIDFNTVASILRTQSEIAKVQHDTKVLDGADESYAWELVGKQSGYSMIIKAIEDSVGKAQEQCLLTITTAYKRAELMSNNAASEADREIMRHQFNSVKEGVALIQEQMK